MTPIEKELCTIAQKRLGYVVPEARLQTEIIPKLQKMCVTFGYISLEQMLHTIASMSDTHAHYIEFVDILTINETSFFRQSRQLESIADQCQQLYAQHKRPLRIWCAACSSGEEAYSLLFLMHERSIPVQILGTDIHKPSLRIATIGKNYPSYRTRNMSPQQIQQFLIKTNIGYDINPLVIKKIQFQYHNLIEHPPPKLGNILEEKTWDIIVCRNVFIYFPKEEVTQVIRKMVKVLETSGQIWLGVNDNFREYQNLLQRKFVNGLYYFTLTQNTSVIASTKTDSQWSNLEQAIQLEQWGEASNLLQMMAKNRSVAQSEILCTQSVLAIREHNFSQAELFLQRATIYAPNEATLFYLLGVIAHKKQHVSDAKKWLEQAIQHNSSFWPAHFLLGQYAYKTGDTVTMVQHLHHAKNNLAIPLPNFLQSTFVHLVESVHNNVNDVRTMIDFYLHT